MYNNCICDVRDYIYERALKNRQGLRFHVLSTDRWVTIPFNKLYDGELGTRVFKSYLSKTHPTYRLVSFMVTPQDVKDKEKEPEQLSIRDLKVPEKHLEAMRAIFK